MATIDELERLDRETADAERQALVDLAEHLRAAVLDMPSSSQLARTFIRQAKALELSAVAPDAAFSGKMQLKNCALQIVQQAREDVLPVIAEAMHAAAQQLDPADPFKSMLDNVADVVNR